MAFNPIIFWVNAVTGNFENIAGGATAWPAIFQGDTRDLQIGIVTPTGNPNNPFTFFNGAGETMYVTIGATPKGDGTQIIYAGPLAMAWNNGAGANGFFTGSLNLTGANLATAIGTGASVSAVVEINISGGGQVQGLYQNSLTIFAPENPGGVVVPNPPVNYLTAVESYAAFVPKSGGNNGDGFFMLSPAGTKRFISLNDDGTLSVA